MGDHNMAGQKPTPVAQRFWAKVFKTHGCWYWIAQTNNHGYGCFSYARPGLKGKNTHAHRMAWLLTYGEIPDGVMVLHHCDTPACVRPDHLFLGTQTDNMRDCSAKGRVRYTCPTAKVTPDQIRAIRADPRRHHIIAADYGMKRLAVWEIKHRRTWADID